MLRTLNFGLLLLLAPLTAMAGDPFQANGQCPEGSRPLTYDEAQTRRNEVCPVLGEWTIARLAHDASMDGAGYGCRVRLDDDRELGHSLCTTEPEATRGDHRHMLEAFEAEYVENGASTNAYALNPGIVHLVQKDLASGNVLFRGNMPVANGVFQYDQLVQALRDAALASGQVLPQTFKVIDISLVNGLTGGEKKNLDVEKAYWSLHPDQGQLINHPIYGSLTSPNSYPSSKRKELEKHPSLGHLGDLIDRIHALLSTRPADGIPVLLYVHCEAGKDRTGEVIGAYAMKYLGMSYKNALANADAVAGRKIESFNKHGLQWHAYYLADYEGIKTIGPIN